MVRYNLYEISIVKPLCASIQDSRQCNSDEGMRTRVHNVDFRASAATAIFKYIHAAVMAAVDGLVQFNFKRNSDVLFFSFHINDINVETVFFHTYNFGPYNRIKRNVIYQVQ